ncbi:MAG: 5'/3'-nucleotidase SurE [Bacteroidales bacterium]|nr:MAG: 5'/3'-nucleotidase SurE [Bacteroidales bacterium]
MKEKRLILVTNDDGIQAPGLKALVEVVSEFGNVVVVAPIESQSGMSHAITTKQPLRISVREDSPALKAYAVKGTPVDCVKLAMNQLLSRKPDLLVSGINHGSNASVSVVYSGTMGAAIEGGINQIKSIGFSLLDYSRDADFSAAKIYTKKIISQVLLNGLERGICLNVNIPVGKMHEIRGIKICRQTDGYWQEEYDKRKDPYNRDYYWLTGYFNNFEPEAEDTDEWALKNSYVSIVPIQTDFTSHEQLSILKQWNI